MLYSAGTHKTAGIQCNYAAVIILNRTAFCLGTEFFKFLNHLPDSASPRRVLSSSIKVLMSLNER